MEERTMKHRVIGIEALEERRLLTVSNLSLVNSAEQLALGLIDVFQIAHPGAAETTTYKVAGNASILVINGKSGNNTFSYTVTETKNSERAVVSENILFSERDGEATITLAAMQTQKPDVASLVFSRNQNRPSGSRTEREINGHISKLRMGTIPIGIIAILEPQ
jgi:hypothetical protein